ncbi:DUF6612 family protein [Halalkalibacterium ligniniphilum]|uniref:DUF6612 family protein n=1 Tax=Halalkalibacterium ligniniphilum TaxID=1134413 RepID=UPI00034CC9B8|nr:DUF6612 family protein [Halalkalibacterium ligniniphilum]
MKKLKYLIASLAILTIAACGEPSTETDADAETDTGVEAEVDTTEEDENTASEDLSAEDILTKSYEAMNEVTSFSSDMDMFQEMTIPGEAEPLVMDMVISMDMSLEPFGIYQQITVEAAEMSEEALTTEQYITQEGAYMYDTMQGTWIKYPDDFTQELLALQEMQLGPQDQIELIRNYVDNISVTEEGEHYVLTFTGEGNEVQKLAMQISGMFGDDVSLGMGMEEIISMMDIKQLDYALYINKDTFYQERIDTTMDMEMTHEGETMTTKVTSSGTMTNFNEVETIEVPTDIVESAEELSFDMSELENMEGIEVETE